MTVCLTANIFLTFLTMMSLQRKPSFCHSSLLFTNNNHIFHIPIFFSPILISLISYMRQEAVLLDLLRVISHHRARLATPIRTVQKFYDDSGAEKIPYSTIFARSITTDRPLLLIDPSPKIHGDEKTKSRSLGGRGNEEQGIKTTTASEAPQEKHQQKKVSTGDAREKSGKTDSSTPPSNSSPQAIPTPHVKSSRGEKSAAVPESPTEQAGRPSFEDNIVLGVALEGSKRTLPIEEVVEQSTASAEAKEVGAARNSNGASPPSSVKDRKGE